MKIRILRTMVRNAGWCCLSVMLLVASAAAESPQRRFSSPEEARQSLLDAVAARDHDAVRAIFGPSSCDLEPGDPVERKVEFERFAAHLKEGAELVREGDEKATLAIGTEKWPFPVPIVKRGDGWQFDTSSGREEILCRRIGYNELSAIRTARAYVAAQREYYAMTEPDGDQIPKFAQRMISTKGRRDGLYWPTVAGEKESPLGPQVAKAKEEGYLKERPPGTKGPRPYHGYYFRILKRQGKSAPGGAYNYVINGNMVGGFALVAYPAQWGASGVMTFIVNQRGRVYQKNLGPKTARIARVMKEYNPDPGWKLVEQ